MKFQFLTKQHEVNTANNFADWKLRADWKQYRHKEGGAKLPAACPLRIGANA